MSPRRSTRLMRCTVRLDHYADVCMLSEVCTSTSDHTHTTTTGFFDINSKRLVLQTPRQFLGSHTLFIHISEHTLSYPYLYQPKNIHLHTIQAHEWTGEGKREAQADELNGIQESTLRGTGQKTVKQKCRKKFDLFSNDEFLDLNCVAHNFKYQAVCTIRL